MKTEKEIKDEIQRLTTEADELRIYEGRIGKGYWNSTILYQKAVVLGWVLKAENTEVVSSAQSESSDLHDVRESHASGEPMQPQALVEGALEKITEAKEENFRCYDCLNLQPMSEHSGYMGICNDCLD